MSTSHKKYDVFISFRGEDTRASFTSHLYGALTKEKIKTYIDYSLQKGDQFWRELVKTIQDSTVSLVVFSEYYASSKWCLDELVEILECRKNHGQVVIPVFYGVDPSHVRHQKGSYERAFRNNESHREKVLAWKAALKEAADISGWDSTTFRNDSEFIESIVRDVWEKLTMVYPKVLKGIQIDENSKHVDSLLEKVSETTFSQAIQGRKEYPKMSTSHKKYDVFISFRGEDTRETFTSHLHDALKKEKIETYIDYKLQKGDQVWGELVKAIQNSTLSLVVFSENYASSKWCLDELIEILECRKNHGQVVIPVFYRVDPSHVRHQKENYEKAFAKYEIEFRNNESHQDKVLAWKAGLKEAASISGWDSTTIRDDSEVIENIVRDVWQKLTLMYPKVLKGIQIDENCRRVDSLLKKVSRIGIWGMGGIGKTTIARLMFVKSFAQYDSVCFMEKVKEQSDKFGLPQVRNNIFTELLKREITTSDVLGDTFIKRRLSGRKVFIVLDNVGNAKQLDDLCGELDELGPNSRLIITRDRHTLRGRVDAIHEVKKWNFEESLNLFTFEAFKQSRPQKGYEGLLERAVAYAGGIPLALKVLGSHFHTRRPEFWKSELDYLKVKRECLNEIKDVLQMSYKGLPEREKEIFLDIAFFYEGETKDFATKILDACGFGATSGIEMLEDKALITISNSNRIQIHDLLQKMAFDIVRNVRGMRNRLRDIEEVRDVLKHKKGADVVEGIMFDLSQKSRLYVRADAFDMMVDLRFLRLYVPLGKKRLATVNQSDQGIMQFSDKLRYFEWNGYPLKCLPDPFCAEFLVEIRLPHSNVEYLWHGRQELVNLEAIDLSECKHLINLPDLFEASKLRSLYLSGCESLCEIQPSIFKDTLVTLLLDRCTNLQSLVSEKHLKALQKINVYKCLSLKEFSMSSDSIESLNLNNTGVEKLHSTIGGMSKLVWLDLEGSKLTNLPKELSCLGLLTFLRLSNCDIVTKLSLEGIFDGLGSLKILYLKGCGNLLELPTNISSLSSLYELRLDGSSLETLPSSIKFLSELEILCLDNCRKLHSLPELPLEIKEFRAENCTSLVTVSSLKTFAEKMKGKEKYISFKNDVMMNLNQPSFDRTVEDVILTMQSVAFHNILVRQYSLDAHSYNYNSAVVCLPGSKVPSQIKYRTSDSKLTIGYPDIYFSLGFIFWVVISPSNRVKNEHGSSGVKIQCKCYRENGNRVGIVSEWYSEPITNLNMEHVFVWYDPYHSDSILGFSKKNVSFEFFLTNDMREHDGVFDIKECGICPILSSELPSLLSKINLSVEVKSDLCDAVKRQSK